MATAQPNPPANLVEKLAAVMAAVEHVPKNGTNEFHKYKYAFEADIADAVRSSMARYGVMLIPSVAKVEWGVLKGQRGEQRLATLTVHYTVTDGKEKIEFDIIGEGADAGDKATYKAMTGATKYALLKLFLIPTGDDPEKDEDEKPQRRQAPPQQAARTATSPSPQPAAEAPKSSGPPPYVIHLWNQCAEAQEEAGAKKQPKTRAAFEEAGKAVFGGTPKASSEWTERDCDEVRDFLFPRPDAASLDDVPFAPFPNV